MGHKFRIANNINKKFGRLLVLKAFDRKYRVKCDCGNEKTVFAQDVYLGKTTSCGCYTREKKTKHGWLCKESDPILKATYRSYQSMKQRCQNPKAQGYECYGGKGIKVCQRWNDSFENFFKDMGKRPSLKFSIHRINNAGDYEPKNCKWATHLEQMQTTSKTKNITFGNVTKSLGHWCRFFGIEYNTVRYRMKRGSFKTYQEAITAPVYSKAKIGDNPNSKLVTSISSLEIGSPSPTPE